MNQRRHHDDSIFDDIQISPEIRWKTSDTSGDEWRVGYLLTIKRKGTVLFRYAYTSLDAATAHLPWVLRTAILGGADGFDEKAWRKRIADDKTTCAQPGCPEPATVFYRMKKIFSKSGEGPLPSSGEYFTGFCGPHMTRGDAGMEDCDDNYEVVHRDRATQ